jgi:hypothetical protein
MALQQGLRGFLGIDMMMTIQMQTYKMKMKKYVQFVRTDLVQKLNWGK